MKAWQVLLLILLLAGGGAVLIAQELRYDQLLEDAREQADTLEVMTLRVNELAEALGDSTELLQAERMARDAEAVEAQLVIRTLEADLEGQQETTALLEDELRQHVGEDEEGQAMVDDLRASHRAEVEQQQEVTRVVRQELTAERRLRVRTDSILALAVRDLEACQCALEQAGLTVDAFDTAADSQGVLGRAWASLTSTKGLVTIGVVGLAAYGGYQLLKGDDEPRQRHSEPYGLQLDVAFPFR